MNNPYTTFTASDSTSRVNHNLSAPSAVMPFRNKRPRRRPYLALALLAIGITQQAPAQFQLTPKTSLLVPGPLSTPQLRLAIAADFNNDGYADIAYPFTSYSHAGNGQPIINIQFTDGKGGTKGSQNFEDPFCSIVTTMVAGDFNGDGNVDIVYGCQESLTYVIALGDGKGGFQGNYSQVAPCGTMSFLLAGDFNGDGKLDLLCDQRMLLNDGNGDFVSGPVLNINWSTVQSAAVADFNGDGKLDFAFTDSSSAVTVEFGDGKGGFSNMITYPTDDLSALKGIVDNHSNTLAVGDINGDGIPDIVVAHHDNSNQITDAQGNVLTDRTLFRDYGSVDVLIGDGKGNFTPMAPIAVPGATVALGDFNGDGRLDIASASNVGRNFSVLWNFQSFSSGSYPCCNGALDTTINYYALPYNIDTLYFEGLAPAPLFWSSLPQIRFSTDLPEQPDVRTLVADFNGDGVPDILVLDRFVDLGDPAGTSVPVYSPTGHVWFAMSIPSSVSSRANTATPFASAGLNETQSLISPNSKYAAIMQKDGNFVVYDQTASQPGTALWNAHTENKAIGPYRLAVQSDGNLVIYGSSSQNVSLGGFGTCAAGSPCIAIWSTGLRGGTAPYTLTMQDDGNLVMYDSTSLAVWFTGTQQ